jgi:hypothetical protein
METTMLTTTPAIDTTTARATSRVRSVGGIEALYATGHWLVTRSRPEDAACVFRAMILLAPADERGWLGLGACHEAVDQPLLALELYGAAQVLLRRAVRCRLARARVLRVIGLDDEADDALLGAEALADEIGDDTLIAMALTERLAARTP